MFSLALGFWGSSTSSHWFVCQYRWINIWETFEWAALSVASSCSQLLFGWVSLEDPFPPLFSGFSGVLSHLISGGFFPVFPSQSFLVSPPRLFPPHPMETEAPATSETPARSSPPARRIELRFGSETVPVGFHAAQLL